ncbi:MAG: DNA (cytosine-5-)-methyltransferase [Actinomycetota bacterium]|nr:DNA (cytosine-5-)-methyltransferase [Actinomycetota bacterium]
MWPGWLQEIQNGYDSDVIQGAIDRAGLIERIDELLEARYRSADLFNLDDPLEEVVFILVSQQTREAVYRRVYENLRRRYPRWVDAAAAPAARLESVLRPAGFQRRKALQLKQLLVAVAKANAERRVGPSGSPKGDLTLSFLNELDDQAAERFLVALPGIGPKSARCVLSYSLDRAVFAVDTHVHRIFRRLGGVPSAGRKADHDPFQDAVPAERRKRLHINLVHHGREVCRSSNERCGECVLVSFCGRGREAVSAPAGALVAVDLFAGAGGLGSGFRRQGYRVALAVEAERHAAQTYRLNNPGVPVIEAKVTKSTSAASLRRYMPRTAKVDVLLAGPPCQGYSAAGSRRPDDPQNQLFEHVARLARQLKVEFVVLENVPGVRRVSGHGFLDVILNSLKEAGFSVAPHLLRASDFGVPQRRLRYFFIARRGRRSTLLPKPSPSHRRYGQAPEAGTDLPETSALLDLLNDLPVLGSGVEAERLVTEDGRELLNMSTMRHSDRVLRRIAGFKAGEEPISYRRLGPVEARTVVAGHRALPVHPVEHRTISVREAAVVQGFPLDYFFCGPRAEQPLQVANAVPPPLAAAVARHLKSWV